jgi:hypothetical protein
MDRSGQIHNVGTGLDFPEKAMAACLRRRAAGEDECKDNGREDSIDDPHGRIIGHPRGEPYVWGEPLARPFMVCAYLR